MFSRRSNASKFALASAVALFKRIGIEMIDCQIPSAHLARLGAEEIPRQEFLDHLQRLCKARRAPGVWTDQFAQLETDTEAD
jgi:leucyl/phenylalanyl-tRNA--protein transferase